MSQAGIVDFEGSHPQVPTTFVTNMGTAVPIGNTLEILGTIVAAHSIPLETTGSGNTVTIVTQYSSSAGASVGTNAGLASFSSTYFTVDANGFVTLNGSVIGQTITGNTGGALAPTSGNWNILGTSTAPGTTPVQTSGTGSTLTVQVQKAQAIASTNATNVGLAAFNSTYFSVDANGFVSLVASSVGGDFTVDASTAPGTNPVVPNGSGVVTITGGQVPAGTTVNVIQTNSLAANTYTIQIQRSQAVAASTVGDNGVSHFSSTFFTVDSNGFVSLNGSNVAETITGNTGGAISPTAWNWNILGTSTAAGAVPVQTFGNGNTLTVRVQKSQAIASTNAANVGLSAFNSTYFTVDANGFVSLVASSVGGDFTVDASTAPGTNPVVPNGSGVVTIRGGQVPAGTTVNVIQTNSLAANTYTIQIQRSQAVVASTVGDNGVSHFNSTYFTVDANGFVSLNGSAVGETITGNTGGALSPTAGNWNILGTSTVAGTAPVQTSGTGSTLTVQVQKSQAIAATDATKIGLANFDSASFTVDANGFVQLIGGATAIEKVNVQTGTTPIVPSSGAITINGATVAAGTNPIRTDGTGANTMAVQVQISQAIASTDATKIGLSNFNSAFFTVDANGFVSLNGSAVGETITGNSGGALSPSGGNWNILGATVVAGTAPLVTSGSGSTLTINAQRSQAIASTDATKIGLAAFNSADFTVDANGFVSSTGVGFPWSDTSGTVNAATNNGYFITTTCTSTLPASPNEGDIVRYVVDTTNLLTITGNTGQKIRIGTTISAAAGTCVNTQRGDTIELVYRTTGTTWFAANNPVGGWNIT